MLAHDLIVWTQALGSTASSPRPNRNDCATGCCTSPPGSRSPDAGQAAPPNRLAMDPGAQSRVRETQHAPSPDRLNTAAPRPRTADLPAAGRDHRRPNPTEHQPTPPETSDDPQRRRSSSPATQNTNRPRPEVTSAALTARSGLGAGCCSHESPVTRSDGGSPTDCSTGSAISRSASCTLGAVEWLVCWRRERHRAG